jgi:hypothetical protein
MPKKRTAENEIVLSSGAAAPARRKTVRRPRTQTALAPETNTVPAAGSPIEPESLVAPAAAASVAVAPVAYRPSREEIAARAYSFWEARGYQGGSPEEDWLRAESELTVTL